VDNRTRSQGYATLAAVKHTFPHHARWVLVERHLASIGSHAIYFRLIFKTIRSMTYRFSAECGVCSILSLI
jgi:hypothetical protein